MKITHIINPVKVSPKSDLFIAQPVTFETMRRAKEFVKKDVEVNLVTTQYPEDREIIPEYFTITKDLERSVLDMGEFQRRRKLPLLVDILNRAIEHDPKAQFIIYTNADIALKPDFYQFVHKNILEGLDAFVINRRTIGNNYSIDNLEEAFGDIGEKHPGFDCFIFDRQLFDKFDLQNVAIGISKVGITLLANLICFSKNFRLFTEEHLTFHIGEDRVWEDKSLNDYFIYNCQQAYASYQALLKQDRKIIENAHFQKHLSLLEEVLSQQERAVPNQTSLLNKIKSKLSQFW